MSPPGPPHPHPPRYRHSSGHSELEPEEGGPSVQYSGNYYGEPDIERESVLLLCLDSEQLEKYRLERKRERNRIAATKCRYETLRCDLTMITQCDIDSASWSGSRSLTPRWLSSGRSRRGWPGSGRSSGGRRGNSGARYSSTGTLAARAWASSDRGRRI